MNIISINIMVGILTAMLPIIILNYKEIKTKKNFVFIWGILSFIISILLLILIKISINYFSLISTVLLSSLLNYFILDNKINLKAAPKSLIVFLLFFLSTLFQLIPAIVFNLDIDNLTANQQLLLTMFSDSILLVILIIMYYKTLKEDFKKLKGNLYKNLDIGIRYWLIGLIVMIVSNIIILLFIKQAQAGNEESVQTLIKSSSILSLLTVGIIAPIIEELTFRKAFKDVFKSKWLFAISSSFVFGGLHVFLSLNSLWDLVYLLPYCSLGFAFSYMYYKTDNIYTSMFIHIFHNTVLTSISIMGAMILL